MEFLIDGEGRSTALGNIASDDAVWKAGFIHLHQVEADSVVVRLRPELVHGKTLAAALYQLADLAPKYIVCTSDPYGRRARLIGGVRLAQVAIARLIGEAHHLPSLCSGCGHDVSDDQCPLIAITPDPRKPTALTAHRPNPVVEDRPAQAFPSHRLGNAAVQPSQPN